MMKIKLITLGKLKEKYLSEAVMEYQKRLSAYAQLTTVEISPALLPEKPSAAQIDAALKKEAEEIIKRLDKDCYKIALCVEGKQLSSEQLAEEIEQRALFGDGNIAFIIGSSYGLADKIKEMANLKLSFSKMTFPHQLMRGILLEQIYRAFKINEGGTYHK